MAKVVSVEIGGWHVAYFMSNNTVKVCGSNGYGELGLGDETEKLTPTSIPDLVGVKQVLADASTTFFLMEDGTVKVCGSSSSGSLGLGDNDTRTTLTLISNLTGVKQISAKSYSTFFLLEDGTVKVCGDNGFGQLGLGDKTKKLTPTSIPNLIGVKQVFVNSYGIVFLLEDGTVKTCGCNDYGQLGVGDKVQRLVPTLIPELAGVNQVFKKGRDATFFLLEDGTVKACGGSNLGQLGVGDASGKLTPTLIPNLVGVKQVSSNNNTTFFLLEDGTVKACGYNAYGELGLGDKVRRTTPILIPNLTRVKQVLASVEYTFFLLEDGTVKACGRNNFGQLGLGDKTEKLTPTSIQNLIGVKQVFTDTSFTFFLLEDGTVKACGNNYSGELGLGDKVQRLVPTLIPGLCTVDTFYLYLQGAKAYAEQNGSLVKVADDYTTLTDDEKKLLFESANSELASTEQLNTLNKFKILRCSTDSKDLTCNITAVPQVTRIEPSTLLTINNVGISKVALEAQGICKVYVTTDLATYKSFDFVTRTWSANQGIDAAELQNIKLEEWDALLQGGKQIAFAYELDLLATQDISHIANLTITTYLSNEWAMAMPGTDYKYSYPESDTLRVSLLTNGDYKINYQE